VDIETGGCRKIEWRFKDRLFISCPLTTRALIFWLCSWGLTAEAGHLQAHQDRKLYFAQRWKGELDEQTQWEIYNHPAVADYLRRIGAFFDYEQGLMFLKSGSVFSGLNSKD